MCGTAGGPLWVLSMCPEPEATWILAVGLALLPCLRCLCLDYACLYVVQFNMPKVGSAAENSWGNCLRKQGAAGHVLSQTRLPFTKLRETEWSAALSGFPTFQVIWWLPEELKRGQSNHWPSHTQPSSPRLLVNSKDKSEHSTPQHQDTKIRQIRIC